jgi:nitrate reductase gamma subunit
MEALIVPGIFGAFLAIIGLTALAIDRRQQRRHHTKSE